MEYILELHPAELITICSLSAAAGATMQYTFSAHLWPHRHRTYTWVFSMRNHRKLGIPKKTDQLLDRDGYSLGYSHKFRCALWVSYTLSKHSVSVDVERGDRFYPDLDIPQAHRTIPDDFKNTGFDRGHLAPSAAIDFSRKSNDETFAMSNIALQHPQLNRQAWGRLEGIVRSWAKERGKMAVVTGPIFGKRNKRINGIAVPRSFYKIVYSFKHQQCIAFVMPNKPLKAEELWHYTSSVEDIEAETKCVFFKKLGNKGKSMKRGIAPEWWRQRFEEK